MASTPGSIQCVLFDIGGVLVELGGVQEFGALIGASDEQEIWSTWIHCEWVKRYERGHCSTDEFAVGMVETFGMEISPARFLERFETWPVGLYEGALDAVAGVAGQIQVGCLSNSNELHWQRMEDFGLDRAFGTRFVSHHLGMVKPDLELFDHVVEELAMPADRVLFLDDNQINVDAARQRGIVAERVASPGEAVHVLRGRGLFHEA